MASGDRPAREVLLLLARDAAIADVSAFIVERALKQWNGDLAQSGGV